MGSKEKTEKFRFFLNRACPPATGSFVLMFILRVAHTHEYYRYTTYGYCLSSMLSKSCSDRIFVPSSLALFNFEPPTPSPVTK